jgi:hypothetical protein
MTVMQPRARSGSTGTPVRSGDRPPAVPMPPIHEVIAARYVATDSAPVLIEIGMPRLAADTTGVLCGYRIHGIGGDWVHGSDSIAALYRTFQAIVTDLAHDSQQGETRRTAETSRHFPAVAAMAESHRVRAPQGQSLLAARTLQGPEGPVSIIIGRPYYSASAGSYLCRVHSSGHRTENASGVDEIEALLGAIQVIEDRLDLPPDWPISRLS